MSQNYLLLEGLLSDGKEQKSVDAIATIHVKKPKMCKERLRNASILIMIHKIHNLKSVKLRGMDATNVILLACHMHVRL